MRILTVYSSRIARMIGNVPILKAIFPQESDCVQSDFAITL
ncbi:hypothetical protein T01_8819 [Trichinella spiralis]|uniref:Uncharacterized protein n=1 Tax=Trichinella spiralis TaxID=6334 RepID=A0A0V0YZH0_TRISP|nr:hypothetical protein T01_8819 [Trichinella spiralis]